MEVRKSLLIGDQAGIKTRHEATFHAASINAQPANPPRSGLVQQDVTPYGWPASSSLHHDCYNLNSVSHLRPGQG